jgi:hypothetical protein
MCTFVLENIDARARRRAAAAAITELVTVAAVGLALAPTRGATGALVALCAGQTMKAAVLFKVLGSIDPSAGQAGARPEAQPTTAREVVP